MICAVTNGLVVSACALGGILLVAAACDPNPRPVESDAGTNEAGATRDAETPPAPACNDGEKKCGGRCTATLTDAANCGGCGHSCLGAACKSGTCEPLLLATGTDLLKPIAMDATHIVFARSTPGSVTATIHRVPKAGGPPTLIAATGIVHSMSLASDRLVWSAAVTDAKAVARYQILTCTLPECKAPAVLVGDGAGRTEHVVAHDGTRLFWVDAASAGPKKRLAVESCALATCGASTAEFYPAQASASAVTPGLAVTPNHVFWSSLGLLNACPRAGCTGSSKVVVPGEVGKVATDGTEVFFWSFAPGSSKLLSCPVAGCSATPRIIASYTSGTIEANDVAVDDKQVYLSLGDTVDACPKTGCVEEPVPVIGPNVGSDATILADETSVYVVRGDTSGNHLVKAPK